MPEVEPNPRQTLAVFLGASSFRRAPKLAQGRAFYNSAEDFHDYLKSSSGLGLPRENVNWLFDDSRSPSDQLQDVGAFLETRSNFLKSEGILPLDLIVYYVGHGLFSGSDHNYYLAVRATDEQSEGLTSMRAGDLASIIKTHARFLRKFLILDCCFSAAAYKEFQSGPLAVGRVKLLEELPQRGTSLLCSASAHDPSLAPEGLSRTMFSDSLIRTLRQGHPTLGPRLSLSELGDLVKLNIREAYPDIGVRPEVHSPDQREGDVASIGLFPNVASAKLNEVSPSAPVTASEVPVEREEKRGHEPSRIAPEVAKTQRKAKTAPSAEKMAEAMVGATEQSAARPAGQKAILKLASGRTLLNLGGHRENVCSLAWSPDGKRLATGSADGTAKVWDTTTGKVLLTLRGEAVYLVAWSPDGKRLATCTEIWDATNGKKLLSLCVQTGLVHCVSWSPNGKQLATSREDEKQSAKTQLWDADTGMESLTLTRKDTNGVYLVAWSPDGKRLASGTECMVWDAKTGEGTRSLTPDEVVSLPAWSPNGERIAAAIFDGPAKVWNVETGKVLLITGTHHGPVVNVCWSPDGRWLATGNEDKTASVWSAEDGEELLTLNGHQDQVTVVAWSPDGKRLATGSPDNTAKLWEVGK